LVNLTSLEEVATIKLVARGSEVSDDGVGGEEGSLFGFEEGKSIEGRESGEIGVSVVIDLFDLDLESIDDRFNFSVSAVGDSIVAEVELHDC